MIEYPKIHSPFHRDENGKFIDGAWSKPEFEYLVDSEWEWTEKVDGTNIRIHWDGSARTFGGRTDNAQIPAPLYAELERLFRTEILAEAFGGAEITLFGEGYGGNIQKVGRLYSETPKFILFDAYCGGLWLKRDATIDIAAKLAIDHVHVFTHWPSSTLRAAIGEATNGFVSRINLAATAEGVVGRPLHMLRDRRGDLITVKLKTKDFRP